MNGDIPLISEISTRFGSSLVLDRQTTSDGILTLWVPQEHLKDLLQYLKTGISKPFSMLYDLTALDERRKAHKYNGKEKDFTVVYHLTSIERNEDVRLKVALEGEYPSIESITGIWPSANWYEREIYDMFGITFTGHPNLRRILLPRYLERISSQKGISCQGNRNGPVCIGRANEGNC